MQKVINFNPFSVKEKFSAIRSKMLLRRTKQLIADQLPTKEDQVVYCRLTAFQEKVYKCLLDHPLMRTVMRMDQPCDCGSGRVTGICCNVSKVLNYEKKSLTVMVNNSTNINKTNNCLLPQLNSNFI
jgi:SNF2 family DNA or RNA helicase